MNKCGYVSAIGRPNAGKSSLLNWLVGEKINMVSHKANATRKRSNTIVMHDENQIIFVDTPGLHKQEKLINQFMLEEALKAMGDCDIILFLAPVTDKISHYEKFLELNTKKTKHILLLTKTDFVTATEVHIKMQEYKQYANDYEKLIPISIKKGTKQELILDEIIQYLPKSPYLYDTEILTDTHLREIYKEFIRESIFDNISDEIPYEADVIIDKVQEKPNVEVIKATIIVEKSTQKGMIIGKGGEAIKRIGLNARKKIEKISQKKVYLELFVSVKRGWSKNKTSLKELGYDFE
jgi:GTP-binding protein Era